MARFRLIVLHFPLTDLLRWRVKHPRGFDFSEFSFIARNIENLVFQSAERGFRGRCTRLVAKCKPEKQRVSELAKWVRDCLHLLSSLSLVQPHSLSLPTPHPLERASSFFLLVRHGIFSILSSPRIWKKVSAGRCPTWRSTWTWTTP